MEGVCSDANALPLDLTQHCPAWVSQPGVCDWPGERETTHSAGTDTSCSRLTHCLKAACLLCFAPLCCFFTELFAFPFCFIRCALIICGLVCFIYGISLFAFCLF